WIGTPPTFTGVERIPWPGVVSKEDLFGTLAACNTAHLGPAPAWRRTRAGRSGIGDGLVLILGQCLRGGTRSSANRFTTPAIPHTSGSLPVEMRYAGSSDRDEIEPEIRIAIDHVRKHDDRGRLRHAVGGTDLAFFERELSVIEPRQRPRSSFAC